MNEQFEKLIPALEKKGYTVSCFDSGEAAADYLCGLFDGAVIGFGDSVTMSQMHLYERLSARNTVYDPKQTKSTAEFLDIAKLCLTTDYFFTSVNAVSEDGTLVNMDGTGNRIAGSLFGHKKVFFIVGRNKIEPDLEKAIWRVRNVAAPKNALRTGRRTPCAFTGKCQDCSSPQRMCNALLIQLCAMKDIESEVVLIDEDLGF